MNKTIIININGIVFHIEEDAYEILKRYMTDVKRHFIDSADSLEITTDIENRLAEMFNEILVREGKQVIADLDVKAVIEQMGTVEDFEHAEDDTKTPGHATYPYKDKMERRRLYRDPDDHLVAGVCAGIANYFDVDNVWIRLAFGLSFAFFGSGLLLYIVLWIVVPKALTRADRMAMKGEKLDLQGFKKNFEDELNTVRGHVNNLQNEAKPFIYKSRDFISDFFHHLGAFTRGAGKFFLKFIGFMVLLACFGAGVALIVGIVTFFAFGKSEIIHVFPFNIVDRDYNTLFFVCGFLLLALPLLGMILLIIRLIFDRATLNRSSGFTLLVIWIGALSVVVYFCVTVLADFRSSAGYSQSVNLKRTTHNTYYLKLNNARFISSEDSIRLNIKEHFGGKIILDGDNDNESFDANSSPNNISIRIEKSDVAQPVLEESFSARGHSYADALMNAQYITYQFTQKDTVLTFDKHLQKPLNRKWRDQDVKLVLKMPLNSTLVIDQDLDRYLDGFSVYQCERDNKQEQAATFAKFLMTDSGLQCKIDTAVIITPKQ